MLRIEHSEAVYKAISQAAEAWLPTPDPEARAKILEYLHEIAASGIDPIAALREGLKAWFGPRSAAALSAYGFLPRPHTSGEIYLESLGKTRRPTMWPRRPKRIPGELLSSWLWRTAVAAEMVPRDFIRDLTLSGKDIDREITAPMLMYLGQRSGQSFGYLAAGALVPWFEEVNASSSSISEEVLLKDGRFLLSRPIRHRQTRQRSPLQYCAECLRTDKRPYFRRAWRFGHNVVCIEHCCRLQDCCWKCGEIVELALLHSLGTEPSCAKCDAVLSRALYSDAYRARPRQRLVGDLLRFLVTEIEADEQKIHLDALSREFTDLQHGSVKQREKALCNLRPANMDIWFCSPLRQEHSTRFQMLAKGIHYENLTNAIRRRERRAHLYAKFGIEAEPAPQAVKIRDSQMTILSTSSNVISSPVRS